MPDSMNSPVLLTRSGAMSKSRFSWSSLPTQFSQITQSSFRLPCSCFVLSSFIGVFLSLVFSRFPGQRKPCHSFGFFLCPFGLSIHVYNPYQGANGSYNSYHQAYDNHVTHPCTPFFWRFLPLFRSIFAQTAMMAAKIVINKTTKTISLIFKLLSFLNPIYIYAKQQDCHSHNQCRRISYPWCSFPDFGEYG